MFVTFMPPNIYFCTGVFFDFHSACKKRSLSSKFNLDLNSFETGI
jgi:hypothetical protein